VAKYPASAKRRLLEIGQVYPAGIEALGSPKADIHHRPRSQDPHIRPLESNGMDTQTWIGSWRPGWRSPRNQGDGLVPVPRFITYGAPYIGGLSAE
jgi:hypothetical protein